jgi:signal transduction histidine kinase
VAEAVAVVHDEALPRLRELLVLGRRTGVPEHLLWLARDLLDELVAALSGVAGVQGRYTDRHRQLGGLALELDAVLQRLRRHIEQHFRSDLAGTIERVLVAQRDALMAASVSVTVTPHEAAPAPQVAIDVQDLEFVLDNLVGNAVRAMDGSSRRELHLDWSVSGERVLMTVADTGCGIAPDDWDAIFDEGWSTRPGGGYGLARSRHELKTYGGSLRVLKSTPGQGTTFVLMVPVARDEDQPIYHEH